jgi:probable addiction module antidote protein
MPAPDDIGSQAALAPAPAGDIAAETATDDVMSRLVAAGCTVWNPDDVLATLRNDQSALAEWVAEALALANPDARRQLLETALRAVGSDALVTAILASDGTRACGRPPEGDAKALRAFFRTHLEAIPGYLTEALGDPDTDRAHAALNLAVRAVGARDIAAEIGTAPTTVYKAFQPRRDPSLRLTLRILRAMGLQLVAAPR